MRKKLTTIAIAVTAIVFSVYIVYDHFFAEQENTNDQLMQQFLSGDDSDRSPEEDFTYSESEEIGGYPGMMAPALPLEAWGDREDLHISDYKGDFVILNAWASWCAPCRDEIPYLIDFHENYLDENVQVLGINMTNTETSETRINTFIEELSIPYDLAMDREGLVEEQFRIQFLPSTFIIDPDGRIAVRKMGYATYDMIVDMYEEAIEIFESNNNE
ncbi:TlpA disulfide reductase family protein [Evansella sp. AB-P1]|uniref:TlpA family protein disulfide reductase n=1 Tax=Evansella sp. AB-P1 TaxID=3037653 RepID=UPI00241DD2B8|nr:TlpA disulfide reductase family protein [Evansella sp. AB-P1]MDG5788017.1 TlpA disulfide reductase family protein [Evansella sp. AB-P1]